jgi:GAF domain-containing protein
MSLANAETEKRRLKVLWQYEVLDTIPEQLFDDLTELAAVICEAPIALISMVDERRQWFKSRFGTTVEETSRDVSFCAYAIQQSELFIIPDATQDERFANNPLVISDPKIRFYAGAPLITPDGYGLGTLCVIDKVPRELRPDQKQALRILARHAVLQLELRRRTQDVRSGRAKMTEAPASGTDEEIALLKTELAKARRDLRQASKKKVKSQTSKKPIRPVSRRKPARTKP